MRLIKIVDDNGLFIGEDFPENIPNYPYLMTTVVETEYTQEVVGVGYKDEIQTVVLEDGTTQEVPVSIPYDVIESVPHTVTKEIPVTTEETYYEEVPVYETVPVYDEDGVTVLYEEQVSTGEIEQVPKTRTINVLDPHYVETPCPDGFYHPKWDATTNEWIEGGVAPTPVPQEPTLEEQLNELKRQLAVSQEALDFILMGGL